jgi:hypothetical protein
MKVATGGEPNRAWAFVECGVGILEILTILTDLDGRVQHVSLPTADPATEQLGRLGGFAAFPLFKFDDDGLIILVVVASANHAVDATRAEWELVFKENAVIAKRRQIEDVLHCAERVSPRTDLCRRRIVSIVSEEGVAKALGDLVSGCLMDKITGHA